MFEVNKKCTEDSIDEFKVIGFPKSITQMDEDSLDEDFVEDVPDSRFSANDHVQTNEDTNFKRKLSSVGFKIITEEEVT